MGSFTRGVIVSEALNLAGNTGLTTRANAWLNAWLSSTYAGWNWPFLIGRYGPYNVAQGAASFTFGDGTNTPDKIHRVLRANWADSSAGGYTGWVDLGGRADLTAANDPAWLSAGSSGLPGFGLVEPGSANPHQWVISFNRLTDKAYRVVLEAQRRPADLTADADVPAYPNDETLVHAVYVQALRHQADERFAPEHGILQSMVANDRVKYGRSPGTDKLRLARGVFR